MSHRVPTLIGRLLFRDNLLHRVDSGAADQMLIRKSGPISLISAYYVVNIDAERGKGVSDHKFKV
jgi:hypothetical protein